MTVHSRQTRVPDELEGASVQQVDELYLGLDDVLDLLEEGGEGEPFLLVKLEHAHQEVRNGQAECPGGDLKNHCLG